VSLDAKRIFWKDIEKKSFFAEQVKDLVVCSLGFQALHAIPKRGCQPNKKPTFTP
jgi:hypothetical protein